MAHRFSEIWNVKTILVTQKTHVISLYALGVARVTSLSLNFMGLQTAVITSFICHPKRRGAFYLRKLWISIFCFRFQVKTPLRYQKMEVKEDGIEFIRAK